MKHGTIDREKLVAHIVGSVDAEESAIVHIPHIEKIKLECNHHPFHSRGTNVYQPIPNKTVVDTATRPKMELKAKLKMFQHAICQIG